MILRKVLELHDIVAVRDSNSQVVASELSRRIPLIGRYPDIVIGRDGVSDAEREMPVIKREGTKLIGINLSSYFAGELIVPNMETMSGWFEFFAKVVSILEREDERKVVFIMTSSSNEGIADEISKIIGHRIQVFGPSSYSHNEIRHLISQMDVYLSMRMHGAIFSFSAGVPCIGLCFTDKLNLFYSDYSLEEYRIDFRKMDYMARDLLEELLNRIHTFIDLPSVRKKRLKAEMEKYGSEQSGLCALINEQLKGAPVRGH